jgi:hypothetical protein
VCPLGITEILFVGDKGVQMKPRGSSQLFSGPGHRRSLEEENKTPSPARYREAGCSDASAMDDLPFSLSLKRLSCCAMDTKRQRTKFFEKDFCFSDYLSRRITVRRDLVAAESEGLTAAPNPTEVFFRSSAHKAFHDYNLKSLETLRP